MTFAILSLTLVHRVNLAISGNAPYHGVLFVAVEPFQRFPRTSLFDRPAASSRHIALPIPAGRVVRRIRGSRENERIDRHGPGARCRRMRFHLPAVDRERRCDAAAKDGKEYVKADKHERARRLFLLAGSEPSAG